MTPNEPGDSAMTLRNALISLECTAQWLENGGDPKLAASEIRMNINALSPTPDSRASIAQSPQASAGGVHFALLCQNMLDKTDVWVEKVYATAELACAAFEIENAKTNIYAWVEEIEIEGVAPAASIAPLPVSEPSAEQVQTTGEPVACVQSYISDRPYSVGKRVMEVVFLRDVDDDTLLYAVPQAVVAPLPVVTAGSEPIGYLHPGAYLRLINGESAGCRQKSYGVQGEVAIYAARIGDEADARDAERYRWLRDVSVPPHNFYISVPDEFKDVKYSKAEVDREIDKAIRAQQTEQEKS